MLYFLSQPSIISPKKRKTDQVAETERSNKRRRLLDPKESSLFSVKRQREEETDQDIPAAKKRRVCVCVPKELAPSLDFVQENNSKRDEENNRKPATSDNSYQFPCHMLISEDSDNDEDDEELKNLCARFHFSLFVDAQTNNRQNLDFPPLVIVLQEQKDLESLGRRHPSDLWGY